MSMLAWLAAAAVGVVVGVAATIRRQRALETALRGEHLQAEITNADLIQTRQWAELAAEVAGLGYWRFDKTTTELVWSPEMFDILAVEPSRGPLSLPALMDSIDPEDRAASQEHKAALLAGQPHPGVQLRIRRPDGSLRVVSVRGASRRNPAGEVTGAFGTMLDVTEFAEAGKALRASEERYRLMAENSVDVIIQLGMTGLITFISPSCEGMLGYGPDELIGRRFRDLTHPDDEAANSAALRAVIDGVAASVSQASAPSCRLQPQGRPMDLDRRPAQADLRPGRPADRDSGGDARHQRQEGDGSRTDRGPARRRAGGGDEGGIPRCNMSRRMSCTATTGIDVQFLAQSCWKATSP